MRILVDINKLKLEGFFVKDPKFLLVQIEPLGAI